MLLKILLCKKEQKKYVRTRKWVEEFAEKLTQIIDFFGLSKNLSTSFWK